MFRSSLLHSRILTSSLKSSSPNSRRSIIMSHSTTPTRSSPFTRAVVQAMRKLYPESLADKSFDNTGLLLEAPLSRSSSSSPSPNNSVLLTIDLTRAVADEAIARRDSVVVAYHPPIFRALKSVTLADSQQQSLLRLACAGISVYSPHTAVDAAPGGLGDWMADIVTGGAVGRASAGPKKETQKQGQKQQQQQQQGEQQGRPGVQRTYSTPSYPEPSSSAPDASATTTTGGNDNESSESTHEKHSRRVLEGMHSVPSGFEGAGMGRMVMFEKEQALGALIDRIARGVGSPKGFPVAIPQGKTAGDIQVRTVAVCAGSGASLFRGVDADLYFTGELSHHDALAITERGGCVVTLFHSNSERGYLHGVMRAKLHEALAEEWNNVRNEEKGKMNQKGTGWGEEEGNEESFREVLERGDFSVDVSERDRDPYGIVVLQDD